MSICALEDMIQDQKQIIEQQKAYLARLDFAIDDDQQREVIQVIFKKRILVTVIFNRGVQVFGQAVSSLSALAFF